MSRSDGAGGRDPGGAGGAASARETAGAALKAAQIHLRKVFILFLLGLVGTVMFMQNYGWDALKAVTEARMDAVTAESATVIVRTPFDVILLQIKLGAIVGALLAAPLLVYYARDALQERDQWPITVTRKQAVFLGSLSVALATIGVAYAYFLFFPIAFDFLTTYTLNLGFSPKYDIVKWTHFILILTVSFALAAQLPLVMSALSYADLVPYEFFREKWRHAVVLIFAFGALFSPPEPFTQILWAMPLVVLYGFSLYLTRFTTAVKRGGSTMVRAKLRRNWLRVTTPPVAVAVAVAAVLDAGALEWVEATLLPLVPAAYRPAGLSTAPIPGTGTTELAVAGAAVGAVVAVPLLAYYGWPELQPRGQTGDPYDLDLTSLDAAGVRAAPAGAFAELSEDEAVAAAGEAMDAGDDEAARAILNRYDEVNEDAGEEEGGGAESVAAETTAGVVGAFAGEGTDEEELGGYAYDVAFVLDSLTSKSFRIAAVFMVATIGTFFLLYNGAFEAIQEDFFRRLPPVVVEDVEIVALHPVEALLFEVKMSLLAGFIAVAPAVGFYLWPAVEERVYGITHDYDTPPPGAAVAERWNLVVGVALAGGLVGYLGAGNGVVPTAPLAGAGLSGDAALYGVAVLAALAALAVAVAVVAGNAIRERWLVESQRGAFLLWGWIVLGGLLGGVALGYSTIAPTIISYLVVDAVDAGMIITYTINDFFWLVFLTTAGIGLLAEIPITMWLFHNTGIVRYRTMYEKWRGVVFIAFVAAAFFTDRAVISMFLFGVPITMMYWFGLVGLWAGTLPGRLLRRVGARA
jgi:sec-independent protein translocase protein TatC